MSDLISRAAAIEAIQREARLVGGIVASEYADMFEYVLKQLPSAQPEKKTCKDCKWEDSFGYGECHHCKRLFEDMWEEKDDE